MRLLPVLRLVLVLAAALLAGDAAWAQGSVVPDLDLAELGTASEEAGATEGGRLSTALEIALLLTALSLLPAILITVTSFTRIVIVLSFVRRALSVNELPPNPVLIGLALFLTLFVMAPVGERLHEEVWVPYKAEELSLEEAGEAAWQELGTFLLTNTRPSELALFTDLDAGRIGPTPTEVEGLQQELGPFGGSRPVEASFTGLSGEVMASEASTELEADEVPEALPPLTVVIPAFVLSELKTAFQMGFLLFLPFLVIDLIVSSVLLSMGMFMLPPVMISTPIKILVFVLVDGWRLISESVVTSFLVGG
jgi:flagellar biosynthetic protein FliP